MREYFFILSKKESLSQASRQSSLFFSQRREDAKRSYTTFAALHLCEIIFLFSQRKKACLRLRESILFFSRKEEKTQRKVIQPLRLDSFARLFSFFSPTKEDFYFSRKEEKELREVSQPLRLCDFARVFF
uniref:hypothetical protein n=1 Tax=Algoriphagus sp. TaxID=1872435 RepID=UPI0040473103